jgi:hypothetical protein
VPARNAEPQVPRHGHSPQVPLLLSEIHRAYEGSIKVGWPKEGVKGNLF